MKRGAFTLANGVWGGGVVDLGCDYGWRGECGYTEGGYGVKVVLDIGT